MEENKEVYVLYVTVNNQIYGEVSSDYSSFSSIDKNITEKVILKTISKSSLYGNDWTSNIFTSEHEDGICYRYIIVYKDQWENYSIKKKNNRLRKIGYQFKNKL